MPAGPVVFLEPLGYAIGGRQVRVPPPRPDCRPAAPEALADTEYDALMAMYNARLERMPASE